MPRHEIGTSASVGEIWKLRPGLRVWLGGHGIEARQEIERHLADVERPPIGSIDLALIAPQSADEAVYFAGKLSGRLAPDASLWIVYPNPSAARPAKPSMDDASHDRPRIASEVAAELHKHFDDMVIGLFRHGFVELGRGAVSDDFAMIGFRRESDSAVF